MTRLLVIAFLAGCLEPGEAHRITATFTGLDADDGAMATLFLRTTAIADAPLAIQNVTVASGKATTVFDEVPASGGDHVVYLHVDRDDDATCEEADGVWAILVTDRDDLDASVSVQVSAIDECRTCCDSVTR